MADTPGRRRRLSAAPRPDAPGSATPKRREGSSQKHAVASRGRTGSGARTRSGSSRKHQAPYMAFKQKAMNALEEFEHEYIASGEFNRGAPGAVKERAGSGSPRGNGGPLPNAVDWWTKLSQMQAELLELKAKEAALGMQVDDRDAVIKAQGWEMTRYFGKNRQAHELVEMRARDDLIAAYYEQLTMIKVWRERTAPTKISVEDGLVQAGLVRSRRNSEVGDGDLQGRLYEEIQLRQKLEDMLASRDIDATLRDELAKVNGELRATEAANDYLREEVLQMDVERRMLGSRNAEGAEKLSQAETQLLAKDHELQQLRSELDLLRTALADAKAQLHVERSASTTHPSVVKNQDCISDLHLIDSVCGEVTQSTEDLPEAASTVSPAAASPATASKPEAVLASSSVTFDIDNAADVELVAAPPATSPPPAEQPQSILKTVSREVPPPRAAVAPPRPKQAPVNPRAPAAGAAGVRPGVGQDVLTSLQQARAAGHANPHSAVRRSASAPSKTMMKLRGASATSPPPSQPGSAAFGRSRSTKDHPLPLSHRHGNPLCPLTRSRSTPQPRPTPLAQQQPPPPASGGSPRHHRRTGAVTQDHPSPMHSPTRGPAVPWKVADPARPGGAPKRTPRRAHTPRGERETPRGT